jgi:hypothetical protein
MRDDRMRAKKKISIVRAISAIAILALSAVPAVVQAQPAPVQDAMAARLSADKMGDIESGSYTAGDTVSFSLDTLRDDKYVLRFADNPEEFVLSADRVALGGRDLKYDTGATALRVTVWGGMTLYTHTAPGGLPATRIGDLPATPRPAVSEADLNAALRDETSHLSYLQRVNVRFLAPKGNDDLRSQAFDTLVNTVTGIERIMATPAGRAAFAHKIDTVKLVEAKSPGISLTGRSLTVHFVLYQGAPGRPSSHAVAVALGKYLDIQEAG